MHNVKIKIKINRGWLIARLLVAASLQANSASEMLRALFFVVKKEKEELKIDCDM